MKTSTAKPKKSSQIVYSLLKENSFIGLLPEGDPLKTIQSGRVMAKAWSKTLSEEKHLFQAQNFIREIIAVYWQIVHDSPLRYKPLPVFQQPLKKYKLDNAALALAGAIGRAASQFSVIEAAYYLGNIYTAVLPEKLRSGNGVFYTPPVLTARLITMATDAGTNWAKAKVVDPACGGGAFLAPVAMKMLDTLHELTPTQFIDHVEMHLRGFELDSFAAWLTQVFVEVALKDKIAAAGRRIGNLVTVCNTLGYNFNKAERFDLVIGNPPYGKLKLTEATKLAFSESLFGHPNLYGLFTHLALDLAKKDGVIAYLTPTSFLSGEYFKNLRQYILNHSVPTEIDFVSVRKGVFDDVQQETMLATYRKTKSKRGKVVVNEILTSVSGDSITEHIGVFSLPSRKSEPWILPRHSDQSSIVPAMAKMNSRLSSWGYKISTGQLVWNRHKEQLNDSYKKNAYPVIWSEAVTQEGEFIHRAEKKNHSAWFHYRGEDYLLTRRPCIILQRTTSKEQEKRLNAAVLPQSLLDKRKAVIVENHLNMVFPTSETPLVNLEVVSAFLNSKAVNDAFRTISGSVAVSAYELEALPIPNATKLKKLHQLIEEKAHNALIEKECFDLYTL